MAKKRGQGEGSIVKRPDGSWMAQVSLGFETNPDGTRKRKRKTVYGKTRNEVKEKLIKLLADKQQGVNLDPEKILFGTWMEQWLELYKKPFVREATWGIADYAIRVHIKPALDNILLSKLTSRDLQQFFNDRLTGGRQDGQEGGLSAQTLKSIHQTIKESLNQAVKEGFIRTNPAEAVILPKASKKQIKPPDEHAISKFLFLAQESRHYPIYALESVTGMRRGELLGLFWEDINFEESYLVVNRQLTRLKSRYGYILTNLKTESSNRKIYLPQSVLEILKTHKIQQFKERLQAGQLWPKEIRFIETRNNGQKDKETFLKNDLVFTNQLGEPINPNGFYSNYKSWIEKAGLPNISFHMLRHAVASITLKRTKDLKVAQELLGHSSIRTTGDIYSFVFDETKKETAAILSDMIPTKKGDSV